MAKNYYDITLSLAGICQAARLVQQLAHLGRCDHDGMLASLESLLQTDPPSTLAVFGNDPCHLKLGLQTLLLLMEQSKQINGVELTRYLLGIIVLAHKLRNTTAAWDALSERLPKIERQRLHFDLDTETIQSALAEIYIDIISKLGPRIQVMGDASILQQPQIQAKIRAILLAGIRSAILWHQVGGRRFQLMFSRSRLIQNAQSLLAEC